jgi:predicted amidohydrolase YtcJ
VSAILQSSLDALWEKQSNAQLTIPQGDLFLNFSIYTGKAEIGDRCLGIENKKGTLRAGADADFVVFDADGLVLNTWVKGKRVWSRT